MEIYTHKHPRSCRLTASSQPWSCVAETSTSTSGFSKEASFHFMFNQRAVQRASRPLTAICGKKPPAPVLFVAFSPGLTATHSVRTQSHINTILLNGAQRHACTISHAVPSEELHRFFISALLANKQLRLTATEYRGRRKKQKKTPRA